MVGSRDRSVKKIVESVQSIDGVEFHALIIGCWDYPILGNLPSVLQDIKIQREMLERYNFTVEEMVHPKLIDLKKYILNL